MFYGEALSDIPAEDRQSVTSVYRVRPLNCVRISSCAR